MNYALRIRTAAEKQLFRLNSPYYETIRDKISSLRENPRPAGCKKLQDRDGWRIRVGHYRVIYEIDDPAKTVTVLEVGHRREVYR